MKIGNIKEIVKSFAESYKSVKVDDKEYSFSLDMEIKSLPKDNLEEWFQKRYNKNVDYDQWVGIRDTLDSMGRTLYGKTLSIIADSILFIQEENQNRIDQQERDIIEKDKEIEKLKIELKKYID